MKIKPTSPLPILTAAVLLASGFSLLATETDRRIESAAKKSYVFKTYLKNDSIKTISKDGRVTLKGTVADASQKSLAEDTVENLPGVLSVDNQLVVKTEVPEEHSDTWIDWKIKSALMFHRNVSATGTEVSVTNGTVTLRGVASSMAQKELTAEYAKDVDNVTNVVNEMTIAQIPDSSSPTMGDKIDDASITAEVKAALLAHRATSALGTKVSTKDSVVTVSGTAKNDAEKSLVTKLVTDINGVTGVVNNMNVAVPVATGN